MSVGPWGDVGDFLVALAPIVLLLFLTVKREAPPPSVALPTSAAVAWLLRLAYFGSAPNELHAGMVASALAAVNIACIIFGAVALFSTAERTGCMAWNVGAMKRYAGGHRVAEAMLVGWAFTHLVEGASGFGTPVALAAPILIQLGAPPLNALAASLTFNGLCAHFGAVGTPVWLGLGGLGLDEEALWRVGVRCALLQAAASFVVVPAAVSLLSSKAEVRASLGFIAASILSVSVPSVRTALLLGLIIGSVYGGSKMAVLALQQTNH